MLKPVKKAEVVKTGGRFAIVASRYNAEYVDAMVRAAQRSPEVAIRIALGAGRSRMVQAMLVEALLIVLAGAAVGLPLAFLLNRIPFGRFGQPSEMASAVLFFASPAASFVTGQILFVDNNRAIRSGNVVDGTSTVVVPPGDFRQLAFSPDGTRVAFLRTNARRDLELVVADAQLRNQVVLAKGGSLGDPSHVGWTPDSRRVVVDEGTTLYAYDLAPNATPTVAVDTFSRNGLMNELTNLFPNDQDAYRLSEQVLTLSEFLEQKLDGYEPPKLRRKAIVHGHCHHKAIMKMNAEEALLEQIGLDFEEPDPGCCGMAGSFGFEAGRRYDVSVAVGERILQLVEAFMPECAWLDDVETLTYLHSTVSTKRYRVRVPETPMYLDALVADQPLTGGLEPRLAEAHLRILTVVGFPTATTPGILDDLNRLAFPYRWSTRAILLDKTDATKLLTKIRRQWFSKRKSIAAILKESLDAEGQALALYRELLREAEGRSVAIEEFARQMIQAEEMHAADVDKMLRKPGDVAAYSRAP